MAAWPYSTWRWHRIRRAQLGREPCCRYCKAKGIVTVATLVDHIIPVRKDKSLAFEPTNLQSMCTPCHSSTKQKEEAIGDETRGCGVDGIPRKGWE